MIKLSLYTQPPVYFCASCSGYEYVALSLFVFEFAFTGVFTTYRFVASMSTNAFILILFGFVGEFTSYILHQR